jgi:hypothetical protein
MGRPRKYFTEEERKAARRLREKEWLKANPEKAKAKYRRYNAKRYQKVPDDVILSPDIIEKTTRTGKTKYINKVTGKVISANKVKKISQTAKSVNEARKSFVRGEINRIMELAMSRKYNADKKPNILKYARTAESTYANRVKGAKLAVEAITEVSTMFTPEQKAKLIEHSQYFVKAAPYGEDSKNFWTMYTEVTGTGPEKKYVDDDADMVNLREMFISQLGKEYVKTFLPFLL